MVRSEEWCFYRGATETGAGLDYSAGAIAKEQSQAHPQAIGANSPGPLALWRLTRSFIDFSKD